MLGRPFPDVVGTLFNGLSHRERSGGVPQRLLRVARRIRSGDRGGRIGAALHHDSYLSFLRGTGFQSTSENRYAEANPHERLGANGEKRAPLSIPPRTLPHDLPHQTGAVRPLDGKLLRIAAVVIAGSFMSVLDTTSVTVAIKELSRFFGVSLTVTQWVSTGYLLALATVIPLTGWAADRFGTKRLFIGSILLFALGAALCSTAWSATSLIAFRVLQGLGGGMIMPAGMTILTHAAGGDRIARIMGLIGVPILLAPISWSDPRRLVCRLFILALDLFRQRADRCHCSARGCARSRT